MSGFELSKIFTKKITLITISIAVLIIMGGFFHSIQREQTDGFRVRDDNGNNCKNPTFKHDTIAFDEIEEVTPPGSIIAGSLKAHSYLNFKSDTVEVVAPTNMTLVSGAQYIQPEAPNKVQYLLDFEADCGYLVRYDHISHPNDEIVEQFSGNPQSTTHTQSLKPIDYESGMMIGFTDGNGVQHQFDFGVYKTGHINAFAEDERYAPYVESEIHTSAVCPYDQYSETKNKIYYRLFVTSDEEPPLDKICSKYGF